jgi:hypothetical protein
LKYDKNLKIDGAKLFIHCQSILIVGLLKKYLILNNIVISCKIFSIYYLHEKLKIEKYSVYA